MAVCVYQSPVAHGRSRYLAPAPLLEVVHPSELSLSSIMAPQLSLLILILYICHSHLVQSYNILAIVSLPLRSHYMAFHPLFRELAIRGHNVTVMNNYPDENPPAKMKFVNMERNTNVAAYITPMNFYESFDSTYLHWYNLYRHFQLGPAGVTADCENFFTNENVRAHLKQGVKYDVIFVEQFVSECGLVYAGAMYDAPIIGITSHVLLPTAYPRLGIPFVFGSYPFYFSKVGVNAPFYYKVEAVLMNLAYMAFNDWYEKPIIQAIFGKYLPDYAVDVDRVARERMRMMFVYQHFSLTGARPLAPQVLEIGGVHIGQPKALPENIERFLSDAHYGAIFVSYGSNLKASTMTPQKIQEYLKAFQKVPQKIIWKYENASLPAGYNNVYTSNWLPQLDILCHPKVIGFVSHGGMLSLSEATFCGKPLVVSPFFGDQFGNAAAVQDAGLGHYLPFDRLDAKSLANAIGIITSPEMQEKARRISIQWYDRPMSVMDSAIYWTEYVARHKSAPPPLPSQQTTWFQKSMLDVALVLIGIVLAMFLILIYITKLLIFIISSIIRLVFGKKKTKKE